MNRLILIIITFLFFGCDFLSKKKYEEDFILDKKKYEDILDIIFQHEKIVVVDTFLEIKYVDNSDSFDDETFSAYEEIVVLLNDLNLNRVSVVRLKDDEKILGVSFAIPFSFYYRGLNRDIFYLMPGKNVEYFYSPDASCTLIDESYWYLCSDKL